MQTTEALNELTAFGISVKRLCQFLISPNLKEKV
jgi:hypothetical protein